MIGYTKEEIVSLYKGAANKVEQISILADLNTCDEATIIEILMDAGVYEGKYKTCIKCGCEFIGEYRRGHRNICPDCRHQASERQRIQTMIKKNEQKIQKLTEKNIELIELLEAQKGSGKCSTKRSVRNASIKAVQ